MLARSTPSGAYAVRGLEHLVSATYATAGLLVLAGLLIVLGAALGPETRDVDI